MFTRKPHLWLGKITVNGAKDFCNTICQQQTIAGHEGRKILLSASRAKARQLLF